MQANQLYSFKPLKNSWFWLLGIATGLTMIHLSITWKREYVDWWGLSVVLWVAVYHLLWKKRRALNFQTEVLSTAVGTIIIALVLLESIYPINRFPYISPFISTLGLALIASGFKELKQYWQELFILIFPAIAYTILLFIVDLPTLTAQFTTFTLWYFGFQVARQGINIILPTGGIVVVNQTCSGQTGMLHLWVLAVLFLVMYPINSHKRFLVPIVASLVGFIINGLRVVLMSILVASSNKESFNYWHTGDGSLVFSMIAVFIFGSFCFFLLQLPESVKQHSTKS